MYCRHMLTSNPRHRLRFGSAPRASDSWAFSRQMQSNTYEGNTYYTGNCTGHSDSWTAGIKPHMWDFDCITHSLQNRCPYPSPLSSDARVFWNWSGNCPVNFHALSGSLKVSLFSSARFARGFLKVSAWDSRIHRRRDSPRSTSRRGSCRFGFCKALNPNPREP